MSYPMFSGVNATITYRPVYREIKGNPDFPEACSADSTATSDGRRVIGDREWSWHELGMSAPNVPVVPFAPQGLVTCAAFSPTGAFVAAGSTDDVLRIWRMSDGRMVRSHSLPSGAYWSSVGWGRRVIRAVSSTFPEPLHELDWPRGRWRCPELPDEQIEACAGDTLLMRSDEGAVWLVRRGRPGRTPLEVPGGGGWQALACVPRLGGALYRQDERVVLVTAAGHTVLPAPNGDRVTCAGSDGDHLVFGTESGQVFHAVGTAPWRKIASMVPAGSIALSVAGGTVAVGGENRLTIVTSTSGREVRRVEGPTPASGVRFDGRTVVCGFDDGRVARWVPGVAADWTEPPVRVSVGSYWRRYVVVDRNHAVVRDDEALLVWRLADRQPVLRTEPIPFTRYGPVLRWPWLVQAWGGVVRIWNLETGAAQRRTVTMGPAGVVMGPEGRILADLYEGTFAWSAAAGGEWTLLERDPEPMRAATTLSPLERGDGRSFAWTASGILLVSWQQVLSRMQLDGSDRLLATLRGAMIHRADMDTTGQVAFATAYPPALFHVDAEGTRLRALWRFAGTVRSVAIDEAGERVAAASSDGSVVVVDLATGRVERLLGSRAK